MQEDIKYFEKVMSLKKIYDLYDNYFCWLYPFTNENIAGYYSKISFDRKNVLTVTGSGDHALNAILLGTTKVECFDMNPLAKYYLELKIAAIKAFSLEEFILFFYNKNTFKIPKYYFSKELYNRLRKYLSGDFLKFWDYVFDKYTSKELYKSFLFTDDFLSLSALVKANLYLQNDNYNELKTKLKNIKVSYHDIGLENLNELNKKFDIIVLSNIPSFLEQIFKIERLKKLKDLIDKISHDNSKVIVSYLYSNLLDCRVIKDDIYNNEDLRRYFDYKKYEYISFESVDTLSSNSNIKRLFPKYDMIFVSKEKEEV